MASIGPKLLCQYRISGDAREYFFVETALTLAPRVVARPSRQAKVVTRIVVAAIRVRSALRLGPRE
jgi:hypothetical protein